MRESAVNNSDTKNDKPFPVKMGRIVNHIANNPAVTLAVGLTLAGFGTIFNPNKKWFKAGLLTRIPKPVALNWPLAGLTAYVSFITGIQLKSAKGIYRHAVGIELNKKDDDVSVIDLLFRTRNTVVRATWKDFMWKILGRATALGIPLLPWLAGHKESPHASIMSGATGIENGIEKLTPTVWDKFSTISRVQKDPTDSTTVSEIKNILAVQRNRVCKKRGIPCVIPAPGSEEARNEEILASYIAKTLDENRKRWESNTPKPPSGEFSPDTFVYLMGNEAEGTGKSFLEQGFPVNLAYVMLAKKDDGQLSHVKEASHAIATGEAPGTVFHRYGIDLNELDQDKYYVKEASNTSDIQQPEQNNPAIASLVPKTQLNYAQETGLSSKNTPACQSCQA